MRKINLLSSRIVHEWNGRLYRNFSHRKFSAIFASPNRYFTQSSRWVPQLSSSVSFAAGQLFVCLFFVAASPLCPVDGLAFALLSDVLSAPRFVVVFFSVAGKSSPARISSQLVNPALLCLLLLLLIARYLQTVTIVSQTLNKQLSVMNKRRQCRASISNPFLICGHEVILDGVNTPWRICCQATAFAETDVIEKKIYDQSKITPRSAIAERVDVRCARDKSINLPRWAFIKT